MANLFFDNWVCLYGLPESIVSDRDQKFTTPFWQQVMDRAGTHRLMTTAFHPEGDGQTERTNATLNMYLRNYISQGQLDWVEKLPLAEFCYNTTVHSSTGQTPFGAAHGFETSKPQDLMSAATSEDGSGVYDRHAETWLARREARWRAVTQALEQAQACYKAAYDKRHREIKFVLGDQVLIDTSYINLPQYLVGKWTHRWQGPYTIVQIVHPDVYRLELGPILSIHPVFHVSKLKKYHADERQLHEKETELRPETTEDIWGTQMGEVSAIVNKRQFEKRGVQYQVTFKGYPPSGKKWIGKKKC